MNAILECGGVITAPLGTIHSPNYPNNYNKNETCEWLIEVEENHAVSITFEDVDLLSIPSKCEHNYIKVCATLIMYNKNANVKNSNSKT